MVATNYEWFIENNLDEYSGKWIAIDKGTVLDSDARLDELLKKIRSKHMSSRPFITRIRDRLLRLRS
ncbi:hypothetical protein HYV82_02640 [Candidatus Woesearchaeota archaeon]|nr:hypothetical protein [Candidatus Woesearchaeota archaeon]